MATESPMRMVEGTGARKWPSSKDVVMLGSAALKDLGAEEVELLLKGYKLHGDQTETVPSRSGSAPPSMEGSFAAIGNLLAQQNFSMSSSFESLRHAFENYESEEQLRSDPAYFAYYCSNVNMNPRLPPPHISRENWRLVRHIGGFGNNWRSSLDDSESLQLSRGSLSTHKEEPEEYKSPTETSENSNMTVSGQSTTSLAGRHKSLVDLIQEDFPRTPSPIYSQSRSSSHTAEETTDHDVHAISSSISSINISKVPESNSGSSDVCDDGAVEHALRLVSDNGPSTTAFSGPSHQNGAPAQPKYESRAKSSVEGDTSIKVQAGISRPDLGVRNKLEDQQAYGRNMMQHHLPAQQGDPYQSLVSPQGMSQSHAGVEKFSHAHPKFSMEGHSSLSSAALNPPVYASAGGYVTAGPPFFPNFHPSGLYSPQYALGGYPLGSTLLPPFMSGYPSHATIPMPFGDASGQNFDGRNTGASAGQNIQQISGLQHAGKFYGQHGLMLQPSFVDPLHMQYIQYPYGDTYNATVQHNRFPYGGATGNQIDSLVPQKESAIDAYLGDPKLEPPTNGSLGIPSLGKVGIAGGNYYGGHPNLGLMTQFPASPLTSPVLPSSPVGGINHLARRNDLRFHEGSSRNAGIYAGGQGQRGVNSFDDPKRHYFLEELKSSNGRKFELSDIAGHIVEFSVDQHGSRFIQQKLEHCSIEEKISVFNEVIPHAPKLMTDVFGNYVIQKFFEHGSAEQRKELADKLAGQMVQLSLQMYGCRVIQKALEVIELDQKAVLVRELDGHVMRCVRDQNGNHVIQKCIECVPAEHIEFIISAFRGHVATLSTHPYGCRVIQRVLEHCPDEGQSQYIVHEILDSAYHLAQDQYGNYVTQHVLERGKPDERRKIINNFTGKIVQMSQHKYASNVIEKCLEYGDASERDVLIEEIIGQSEENLLAMMKDQFANYVVQKILEKSSDKQQEILLNRISAHLNALKKYTYGKHIVTRFEQRAKPLNLDYLVAET